MIKNYFDNVDRTFCGVQFKNMLFSALMLMLSFSLSDAVDIILSAKFFGDNAMAGVNFVMPLLFISAFIALMISTGTSYLYSFEIGKFQSENANKLVGQGAILTGIVSLLLGLIAFFYRDIFFSSFELGGEIETFAREYYSCFFLIFALNPISTFMQMIVYADGGGKNCVVATFASFFVNLAASIVLGSEFGMSGNCTGHGFGLFDINSGVFKMDFY
ncbi:MAG: hypothetical protein IJ685_09085 [Selenomonadaceae bacterium]|nr:hypothetical protein [Selenomonadaceae bacterium]